MLNNKVLKISSIALLIIIAGSYMTSFFLAEHSRLYASTQEYTINGMSDTEFRSKFRCLASTDSSYSNYREPYHGKYEQLTVVDSLENIVMMKLYIKEINRCFSFFMLKNSPNKVYLNNVTEGYDSSSNRNWQEFLKPIYADGMPFNESIAMQNNFEKYVLDKIVSYDKNEAKGFVFWYSHFFIYWQAQFIIIAMLIILSELIIISALKRSLITFTISLSLFPFIIALAFEFYQAPFIAKDPAFFIVFILSSILQLMSQLITNYLWSGTIFYILTIYFYLKRNKLQWIMMWLCIISTILLYGYSFFFDKETSLGTGYYLCILSYIILLIGMSITYKLDKGSKLKQ